jgi:hypothetical protein
MVVVVFLDGFCLSLIETENLEWSSFVASNNAFDLQSVWGSLKHQLFCQSQS